MAWEYASSLSQGVGRVRWIRNFFVDISYIIKASPLLFSYLFSWTWLFFFGFLVIGVDAPKDYEVQYFSGVFVLSTAALYWIGKVSKLTKGDYDE